MSEGGRDERRKKLWFKRREETGRREGTKEGIFEGEGGTEGIKEGRSGESEEIKVQRKERETKVQRDGRGEGN